MSTPVNIRNAPLAGTDGYRGEPGKPYRPSNGTEGELFYEDWCAACARDRAFLNGKCTGLNGQRGCRIIADAMVFNVGDEGYPSEWTYDGAGLPQCTAFKPLSALSDVAHKAHATRRRKRDEAHAGRIL